MKSLVIPAKAGIQFFCVALLAATAGAQDAPPPNAKDLQPRPAEMAPRAAKSLLLAITQAGQRHVAVGDRGVILISSDADKWQQVPSPVHATLTAVAFADASTGWAVGHDAAILHTADGGQTWKLQNFAPADAKPLLGVLALDARRAFAIGAYGLFLGTTDGGATWSPVEAPAVLEDGRHLNSIIALGNGELFIAGETGLLGVSPDGAQWKRLALPYEGSLFGALPRGDKGALVFGLRGNAYVSDDVRAGKWRKLDTQTVQSLFAGTALPGGAAALVGADGEILRVGADGSVRKAGAPSETRQASAGTLAGVLARNGELLVVGEYGVSRVKLAAE